MAIWLLAMKEIRLLLRDRMAALVLLVMPLLFILVLGLLLGEGFGEKPDDRLRIALVDEDRGPCGLEGEATWAKVVRRDLADTGGIKVEIVPSRAEAERLVAGHQRAAVIVFRPDFSERVNQCSFLKEGINPFHRDGVYLDRVGVDLLRDQTQPGASAIIDQVTQVTLLRVLLPWMIGKAFERLSEPQFIELLGDEVRLPVPDRFKSVLALMEGKPPRDRLSLEEMLKLAAGNNKEKQKEFEGKVGDGVQKALAKQFEKYNLTGKTWASLTRATDAPENDGAGETGYVNRGGTGLLDRGAQRYQILVPSYTVMFAFFLVLNVGWVFVAERRQGTLRRLQAAPITRGQVLLGKLVPYFLLSVGQGAFLLLAGRLLFGMRWGPDNWSLLDQVGALLPVVVATSLAAMGLALLVAAVARSEVQVALYGAVPALVLALVGGCVLPREMMPEQAQYVSLFTPQGWALQAYRELLGGTGDYQPNLAIVWQSCGVLTGFGAGFIALAWWLLRLE